MDRVEHHKLQVPPQMTSTHIALHMQAVTVLNQSLGSICKECAVEKQYEKPAQDKTSS